MPTNANLDNNTPTTASDAFSLSCASFAENQYCTYSFCCASHSAVKDLNARLAEELAVFKTAWPFLLFGFFMTFIHSVTTNAVYYLFHSFNVFESPALNDLGFSLLPELPEHLDWTVELLTFGVLGGTLLWGFSLIMFYSPDRTERRKYAVLVLARFLTCSGVLLIGRIVSFLTTILPAPSDHCTPLSSAYNPPRSWMDVLFRFDAVFGCGDLIYSSHTCYVLLCCFSYHRYGRYSLVKALMFISAAVLAVLILCARNHYTVDVWLAWYTVPLVWYAVGQRFPDEYFLEKLRASEHLTERSSMV